MKSNQRAEGLSKIRSLTMINTHYNSICVRARACVRVQYPFRWELRTQKCRPALPARTQNYQTLSVSREDVPIVDFMYLTFTCQATFTVGSSVLCCCLLCVGRLSSAITTQCSLLIPSRSPLKKINMRERCRLQF